VNRESLWNALASHLSVDGSAWLNESIDAIAADPTAIRVRFPAAGRRCGRGPLTTNGTAPGEEPPTGWTVDDAVRALLIISMPLTGQPLWDEVEALYRYGDAGERRAVLRALPLLDIADRGLPIVRDAIRTSDNRLIAAALGPYAAEHLELAMWRQAVLKCVFNGISLAAVAGLVERADQELARMLADFAHERVAAGRDVSPDVWPVIDRFPGVVEASGLLDELRSDVPARRQAAARALAQHRVA
jgi:hypothetical protein